MKTKSYFKMTLVIIKEFSDLTPLTFLKAREIIYYHSFGLKKGWLSKIFWSTNYHVSPVASLLLNFLNKSATSNQILPNSAQPIPTPAQTKLLGWVGIIPNASRSRPVDPSKIVHVLSQLSYTYKSKVHLFFFYKKLTYKNTRAQKSKS